MGGIGAHGDGLRGADSVERPAGGSGGAMAGSGRVVGGACARQQSPGGRGAGTCAQASTNPALNHTTTERLTLKEEYASTR